MLSSTQRALALLRRYPVFRRFWAAKLLSLLGDSMTFIALPWFVLQTTGSGTTTAAILLTLQLPAVLSGMVAGSLIDRFQPRLVLGLDNALRAVLITLIPMLHWLGGLEMWVLFGLAFLVGLLQPITLVGSRTLLPDLVTNEDLEEANVLWAMNFNLATLVGPGVAGILVALFGGPFVLLLDAGTFLIMMAVAFSLPTLRRAPQETHMTLGERLGFRQLWSIKVVRLTTLLSLVFFFSYGPLEAALPLYSAEVLATGAQGYGLLWTALGVGAFVGTLLTSVVNRYVRLGLALPLIALLWGVSLLPLAFTRELWVACIFMGLAGLTWGPYSPIETTLLQRTVPKAQLGRVFGARATVMTSGVPLGLALGGVLLAFLPSTTLIAISGFACMLVGMGGLASPALRRVSLGPATAAEASEPVPTK